LIGSPKRSGRSRQGIPARYRFHKQPIVLGRYSNMAFTAGQNILDPVPLIIPKTITTHLSAPNQLTLHESRCSLLGNPAIEDRP
jgi:hypothetical protein